MAISATTLWVVLSWAATAQAEVTLQAPNSTNYQIQDTQGGELTGPGAFSNWPQLCVRICADCRAPCAAADIYDAAGAASASELNGLQRLTAVRQLAGLNVQRRIFVPSAGQVNADGFIRYLDTLTNPTGAAITASVRVGSVRIGGGTLNGAAATLWRTSNDDAILEPTDRWLVLDDDNAVAGLASTAHLVFGSGARYRPTRLSQRFVDANAAGALAWDYEQVIVAPGQTVSFMSVIVHEARRADAIDEVANLLRASDADVLFGATDDQRRQIVNYDVDPANSAPLASAGGPYNVVEGSPVQLNANDSFDIEGLGLQYAWDFDDDGEFNDAMGVNTVTTFTDDGVFQVRVRVTDPGGKTDIDSARVVVRNALPRLDAVNSDSPIDEGQRLTLEIAASDPGADELFVDIDWDGDGTYDEEGLQGLSFDHQYFADGLYTARVRLRDDEGDSVTGDFPVEVRNVAPVISGVIVPPSTLEGSTFTITVVATDGGNDPITYAYDLDGDNVYEVEAVGQDTLDASFDNNGLYPVAVRVCDDQGACSTRSTPVNVLNALPTITAVTNSGPVAEGTEVSVMVDAADPGADLLSYSYDLDNDGNYDVLDQPESTTSTVFNQQGQYTVGVRVRDVDGGTVLGSTQITVTNAPPTGTVSAPLFVNEGETFDVTVDASDPGDDVLAYDWDLTGDGQFDLLGVPSATQQARFDRQGDYTIRVRITDGDGGEITVETVVSVRNVLPLLEVLVDSPAFEGAEVVVRAVAEDPGNDALLFDFDFDSDGTIDVEGVLGVREGPNYVANARFAYPDQGTYQIDVFVEDDGDIISGSAMVEIQNQAPSVSLRTNSPVDEGGELILTAEVTDPGTDTITLMWDTDGDGEVDIESVVDGEAGTVQTAVPADDNRFIVTVWAADEDGGESSDQAQVIVANVAPTLLQPQVVPPALEGRNYNLRLEVEDPAGEADPPAFSLINPPPGVAIDRLTGRFEWIPTYDQFLASPIELTVTVVDGDGGQDQIEFSVQVLPEDEDGDGLPDTFERNACDGMGNCLNPEDGTDGTQDADGDGRDNVTEWREGTDPFLFDGPDTPQLLAPADGARIASNTPELRVGPVNNPLNTPTFVTFEIYADAELANIVYQNEPVDAVDDLPTAWTVIDGILFEDQTYYWRARAESGAATSDWTRVWSFRVNTSNEAPTAPVLRSPEDGAIVDTKRPNLDVLPSTDADGDTLRYVYRVYRGAGEGAVVETSGEGVLMDGFVRFEPPGDLNDDRTISWDVVAVDEVNTQSEPSERWSFTINTDNDAPTTPEIIYPLDGDVVDTLRPELRAGGSADDDNPEVFYVFRVREREGMEYVFESGDVLGVDLEASFIPEMDLVEDQHYALDVHTTDGEAISEGVAMVEFFVSAINHPPSVPTLRTPADAAKVTLADGVFVTWTESTDPEEQEVSYVVEWCSALGDCEQSLPRTSLGIELTDDLLAGETYTWSVQAFDPTGVSSDVSAVRSFTVEGGGGGSTSDDGCASSDGSAPWPWALGLVGLYAIRRRRD